MLGSITITIYRTFGGTSMRNLSSPGVRPQTPRDRDWATLNLKALTVQL